FRSAARRPAAALYPRRERLKWNRGADVRPRGPHPRPPMPNLLETHSREILILLLFTLVVTTLIVLVPQLLRAHLLKVEMQHKEHLRAIEQGQVVPPSDEPALAAGRMAMLVPMVVMIAAGTVTCFLVVYSPEHVFAVALAVWAVAGIVSLAAI